MEHGDKTYVLQDMGGRELEYNSVNREFVQWNEDLDLSTSTL